MLVKVIDDGLINWFRLELDLDRLNPDYTNLTDLNFERMRRLEVR